MFRVINCVLMIVFCMGFCFIKSYSTYKIVCILLLLAYRVIDSFSEALFGIFQKYNNLFQVGISLTLRSVLTVSVFLVIDIITKNLIYSIIGIAISDLLVFFLYDIIYIKKYKIKFRPLKIKNLKYLIIAGLSVFLITLLTQYITNASKFAIDTYLNNDIQAIYGIILMPATIMTLCSQLIINPFLYNINKALEQKKYKLFRNIIYKIIVSLMIIGLLIWILTLFAGIPILNFLYNIQLNDSLIPLLIIVAGSIIYAISMIFMNALIAVRKNNIQVILFLTSSVFALISAEILVPKYLLLGASLSYLFSVLLLLILYIVVFIIVARKMICKNH